MNNQEAGREWICALGLEFYEMILSFFPPIWDISGLHARCKDNEIMLADAERTVHAVM